MHCSLPTRCCARVGHPAVERTFARVLNFVIVRGFPSAISPFVEFESKWSYLFLTQGLLLLVSAFRWGASSSRVVQTRLRATAEQRIEK